MMVHRHGSVNNFGAKPPPNSLHAASMHKRALALPINIKLRLKLNINNDNHLPLRSFPNYMERKT